MASTLPSAKDLGVVGVQPGLGVATYRGATGQEGAAAQGMLIASREVGAIAQRLDKAQEEFDTIQAEDRFNQYQEKLNQIANDPDTGWRAAKGENATKPEFVQKYTEQFEEERKRLVGTMDTAYGKRRFGQLSAAAALRNRASLYAHAADERLQYEAKVANDSLSLVKNNAWRSHGNDDMFNGELARGRAITESFAKRMGMNEASIKLAVQQFDSSMWMSRIQGALDSGDTQLASKLFEVAKSTSAITTDDKLKIDAKIKPMLELSKAVSGVDKVHEELLPKDLNAPVPTVEIDRRLREMFANDPRALQAARAESDYRIRGHNTAQAESNKANVNAVVQRLWVNNESPAAVYRSKEFQDLPGDQKAQVILQVKNRQHLDAARAASASARAHTEEQRTALRYDKIGENAYWGLRLNEDALKKMSDPEIDKLAITAIGPERAVKLKKERDELNKPIKSAMTRDQFISAIGDYIPEADRNILIKPGPMTDEKREKIAAYGRLLESVNIEIQSRATKDRVPLTLEEMSAIAQRKAGERIKVDYGWGSFKEAFSRDIDTIPGMAPRVGDQATELRARGVIESVPQSVVTNYTVAIKRMLPDAEKMTPSEISSKYMSRMQRAYALQALGASMEEVELVLKGVAP